MVSSAHPSLVGRIGDALLVFEDGGVEEGKLFVFGGDGFLLHIDCVFLRSWSGSGMGGGGLFSPITVPRFLISIPSSFSLSAAVAACRSAAFPFSSSKKRRPLIPSFPSSRPRLIISA